MKSETTATNFIFEMDCALAPLAGMAAQCDHDSVGMGLLSVGDADIILKCWQDVRAKLLRQIQEAGSPVAATPNGHTLESERR